MDLHKIDGECSCIVRADSRMHSLLSQRHRHRHPLAFRHHCRHFRTLSASPRLHPPALLWFSS